MDKTALFIAVMMAVLVAAIFGRITHCESIERKHNVELRMMEARYIAQADGFEKACFMVAKYMCPKECYSNEIEEMIKDE